MEPLVNTDPLMPPTERLPMNPSFTPVVSDPASSARPFVLRGVSPTPAGVVEAKHRTPGTARKIPQETNLDSQVVDDSYTVPDD